MCVPSSSLFSQTKIKVFSGKKHHVKYNLTLSSFVTANVQVAFAVKYLLLFILFSFMFSLIYFGKSFALFGCRCPVCAGLFCFL